MPFAPAFSRRSRNSSSSHDNTSDYHRYSSDHAAENDVQSTAAKGVLNTINNVNDGTIQSAHAPLHADVVPRAVESSNNNSTGHQVEQTRQKNVDEDENNTIEKADDDSSAAWWNLLSNKGSFDTNSVAVSAPMRDPAAANYIQKEKMLRKKAFNRAALGGSIRFDHTFSDESPTSSPYHNANQSPSWGVGLPSKQQDEEIPIEWTPQDSSYGAAVSACGWLPKRIRKLAEAVFVVFAIAILLYAVVKIGAEINRTHSSSSSGGDLDDLDDDDHYIAHNYNNGEDNAGDERFRFI